MSRDADGCPRDHGSTDFLTAHGSPSSAPASLVTSSGIRSSRRWPTGRQLHRPWSNSRRGARELVYRRPRSSLKGAFRFIFKHALLRDAAYETVLLRDRRALHLTAAEWKADHAGATLAS